MLKPTHIQHHRSQDDQTGVSQLLGRSCGTESSWH